MKNVKLTKLIFVVQAKRNKIIYMKSKHSNKELDFKTPDMTNAIEHSKTESVFMHIHFYAFTHDCVPGLVGKIRNGSCRMERYWRGRV